MTQYYPPEVGAPQTRLSEMASWFVRLGHNVTALTAMPNYPTGRIREGYGGFVRREKLEGIDVIRTFTYPAQKADFVRRLSNYFSFVFSSAVVGSILLKRSDYLLVESPPLFLGLSGLWLAFVTRSKLIFNVSDLWPESAVQLGLIRRGGILHRMSVWLEGSLYKCSWLITGQSRSILQDILKRFPSARTFHLSNGVDVARFVPNGDGAEARKRFAAKKECLVMYAGLHGLAQGLDQILAAAVRTRINRTIKYALVGDGPEKRSLIKQAREGGLDNVSFFDPVPSTDMPALLASSDIVLVTLRKYLPGAIPSKLYEAMASGKPVVLVAEGEARDTVEEHKAGIVVSPGDVDNFSSAVCKLSRDPKLRRSLGENGRRVAEKLFDRESIVKRFIRYLDSEGHALTAKS